MEVTRGVKRGISSSEELSLYETPTKKPTSLIRSVLNNPLINVSVDLVDELTADVLDAVQINTGVVTDQDLFIDPGFLPLEQLKEEDANLRGKFGEVKVLKHDETGQNYCFKYIRQSFNMKEVLLPLRVASCEQVAKPIGYLNLGDQGVVLVFLYHGQSVQEYQPPARDMWMYSYQHAKQMMQACSALKEADIAHLDIKPQNVVVERSGGRYRFRLIDFGGACDLRRMRDMRQMHLTPQCVCPALQKHLARRQISAICSATWLDRCDVWSVGIVCFYILTRQLPYGKEQNPCDFPLLPRKLYPRQNGNRDPLDEMVLKMLKPDPTHRPKAETLLKMLELIPSRPDNNTMTTLASIFHEETTLSLPPLFKQKSGEGF